MEFPRNQHAYGYMCVCVCLPKEKKVKKKKTNMSAHSMKHYPIKFSYWSSQNNEWKKGEKNEKKNIQNVCSRRTNHDNNDPSYYMLCIHIYINFNVWLISYHPERREREKEFVFKTNTHIKTIFKRLHFQFADNYYSVDWNGENAPVVIGERESERERVQNRRRRRRKTNEILLKNSSNALNSCNFNHGTNNLSG